MAKLRTKLLEETSQHIQHPRSKPITMQLKEAAGPQQGKLHRYRKAAEHVNRSSEHRGINHPSEREHQQAKLGPNQPNPRYVTTTASHAGGFKADAPHQDRVEL
eukprot:2629412-Amphidinium_carterae.1